MTHLHLDIPRIRAALSTSAGPERSARAATEIRLEKASAVAAILRPAPDGLHVLLIKRAIRDGDPWSGHMAFPGGRQEPDDRDLVHTAIRETMEEVGLDLDRFGELLGALPDVQAIRQGQLIGMSIRPYVYALGQGAPEATVSDEVEAVVWAPLEPLYRGELATTIDYDHHGLKMVLPAHDVRGNIVWGLTHRMLTLLFEQVDALRSGDAGRDEAR